METVTVNKEVDGNTADNPVLEAAKGYIARGWSVIPIVNTGKKKGPALESWKPYQSRLATPEELEFWFGSGDANIGIVTGKISDLVVLDFDTDEAWGEGLRRQIPNDTLLVQTSKGFHLYCRHHESVKNDQHGQVLAGMDIRSEGGYVVAPPSVHESGVQYQWFSDRTPDDVQFSDLPDWVINAERVKPTLADLEGGAKEGNRNDNLTRLLGQWVKEYTFDEVAENAVAWNQKCDPPDDEEEVLKTVKSIWDREHSGLPEDLTGVPWDEPELFDSDVLPEIKSEMVPCYLGEFAKAISRSTQAPEALPVMVGLSVVATCLQKKFVVSPYDDEDFLEPLNLWTVTALNPSERKTPIFSAMTAPLKQWEREKRDSLEDEIIKIETEREIALKRIDNLKKNAAGEEEEEKRQDLKNQIGELISALPAEIMPPRLWTADVTPERLQQLLADHDEKMALLSDEGGIFEVLSGMYANGKINVDVLLQAYSGSGVRIDRGSRAAYLENPALTFGLTVQPGILKELGRGAKKKFRDNGMLARFLYCVPEGKVGSRNVRQRYPISQRIKQDYQNGIHGLLGIDPDSDSDGNPIPHILTPSYEALEVWFDFSQEVEDSMASGGDMESLADWGGKLPGNALRIAGNFHVLKGNDSSSPIGADTMKEATDLCRVLIHHAKAAFCEMGKDNAVSDALTVYDWIIKKGCREFTKRDCQRDNQSRFKRSEELDPVMRELEERAIVRRAAKKKGKGKKSEVYEVNPQLLSG